MKKTILLFLLISSFAFSQEEKTNHIGQVTKDELKLSVYEKDSIAGAVVLYEHANVYIDEKKNYDFRTDYYFRIKIFDKAAFEKGNIEVFLYKKQKIQDIKAVTYNLDGDFVRKSFLKKDQIFTTQENASWKKVSFTLPNLKEGAVIEYTYTVLSPYSQLDDWYFQSDIPKIKSEYNATILANYKYNSRLVGYQKLNKNEQTVKKKCIYLTGAGLGDCISYSYGMNDIPGFKEEDYMLSKKNFLSRVIFDLISFAEVNGVVQKYTKSWKDADKTLRIDFLDGQTTKKNYFKKNISQAILQESNSLKRAKNIYNFIQQKMNWNGRYWAQKKIRVKRVFEESSGSVDAINLILYNSLQSGNIESYLVASSTRRNGLPTKLYPIVNDFNYILVKAVIDGKTYFLDATDKDLGFGEIPFKCLNGDGRVLDFEKGSYWETIYPRIKTSTNARVMLSLNEENKLEGSMVITKKGYNALSERKKLKTQTEEEYLDNFETNNPIFEVDDYSAEGVEDNNKTLKQVFNITIDEEGNTSTFNLNPFLYGRISKNPFKLKERNYPVDYGYPRNFIYMLKLNVPEGYAIKKAPENKTFALPNKGGNFVLKVNNTNNQINIYSRLIFNRKVYSSEEYHALKEFYNQIIQTQKTFITIEKTN